MEAHAILCHKHHVLTLEPHCFPTAKGITYWEKDEMLFEDHGAPNKNGLTPVNGFQAGSICSFSGLNDDPSGGGDPFQDGKVQNWGKVVEDAKALIGDGDHGANEVAGLFQVEGPGTNCRGFASAG